MIRTSVVSDGDGESVFLKMKKVAVAEMFVFSRAEDDRRRDIRARSSSCNGRL